MHFRVLLITIELELGIVLLGKRGFDDDKFFIRRWPQLFAKLFNRDHPLFDQNVYERPSFAQQLRQRCSPRSAALHRN
jgi:hypothetical protein